MINIIAKSLFRYFILVLLQVLILNNIQLGGYINPYLYVWFILMLPFETPVALVMVLGFLLGLTIDMFLNTAGVHAAACVAMGYARHYILKIFAPREGYEFGAQPSLVSLGLKWYLSYAGLLVFVHHTVLFYAEVFRLSEFSYTMLRVILSSIFTISLIILSQLIIYRKKAK
jgi:rod shape-determining protein MreD